MPSIVQMEAKELKQLVSEVKETVATGIIQVNNQKSNKPSFTVVDLWNIHRNMKSAHLGWHSVL